MHQNKRFENFIFVVHFRSKILISRSIKNTKSFKYISLVYFNNSTIRLESSIFGIMDTLKPIDEYIAEIKESEAYKIFTSECRCNNCMTYFESDDDLIDGEDEDGAFKGCPKCNTDKYLMNLANLK